MRTSSFTKNPIQNSGKKNTKSSANVIQPALDIRRSTRGIASNRSTGNENSRPIPAHNKPATAFG